MNEAYIGLDLGTSGLKAVAIAADGRVLARAQAGYPTSCPERGAAEQDPAQWRRTVGDCVARLITDLGDRFRVRSLGLSAMLPTLVTADKDGAPLGAALTWQDARAEEFGDRLRESVGAESVYQRTGQWLDGRYLLPMWVRIARQDRGRAAATTHLLGAKDWLIRWLTGIPATDPSTATGVGAYDLSAGGWVTELLEAAAAMTPGIALPALPDVLGSETALPLTAAAVGELGLPRDATVCLGGADSVMGALGLGVHSPGTVAYVAGTSTVILGIAKGWTPDPSHRYLVTPLAGMPGWGYEMDLLATGSAVQWLTRLLGLPDEATLLARAASVAPSTAPLVLPYLAPGEQGALWNPRLRGAITGLTLADGPAELARGLVDGIVVESRRCLQVLTEHGIDGELHVAGGLSADAGFRADLADAAGRTVRFPSDRHTDYSALGAALLAARSAGCDLAPDPPDAHCAPRTERHADWSALAERLDGLRQAIHPHEPTPSDAT